MVSVPLELKFDEYGPRDAEHTLVILHGLYGLKNNWRSYGKNFSADRRVIIPDLRNHGYSPRGDDMSYGAQVADVRHLLRKLAIKQATILGHSMGGKVAMSYALEDTERRHTYIIADIAPIDYTARQAANHRNIIAALSSIDTSQNRNVAFERLKEAGLSDQICRFLLMSYVRQDDGRYDWLLNLKVLASELENITSFSETGKYDRDIYFIAGARSDYLTPHFAETTAMFPNARFQTIPDCGHWLHAEKPKEFGQCLQMIVQDSL